MDTTTALRATSPVRAATSRAGSGGSVGRGTGKDTQRRPWRLGGRARKAMLLTHIVAAGIWLGVDVIVGVLVFGAWLSDDPGVAGVAYQALGMFVLVPMLAAGLACLASGVVLGLGSKYGLVRYRWVLVKLVLNVVLCVLIVVALRPGLAEVAAYGEALAAGAAAVPPADLSSMFFPPVVSLAALSFASWLSVFKPWGRTRFGR